MNPTTDWMRLVLALCIAIAASPAAAQQPGAQQATKQQVMLPNTGVAIEVDSTWAHRIEPIPPIGSFDALVHMDEHEQVLVLMTKTKAMSCDYFAGEIEKEGATEVPAGTGDWIPSEFDRVWRMPPSAQGDLWFGCETVWFGKAFLSLVTMVLPGQYADSGAVSRRILADILGADRGLMRLVGTPGEPADGFVSRERNGKLSLPNLKLEVPVSTGRGDAWSAIRWRGGTYFSDQIWRARPGTAPIRLEISVIPPHVEAGQTRRQAAFGLLEAYEDSRKTRFEKATWMPGGWSPWVANEIVAEMQVLTTERLSADRENVVRLQLHAAKDVNPRRAETAFADFAEQAGKAMDEKHAEMRPQIQTVRLGQTGLAAEVDTKRWTYSSTNKNGRGYDIFVLKGVKEETRVVVESEQVKGTCNEELRGLVRNSDGRYELPEVAPPFETWPDTVVDLHNGLYLACHQPRAGGPMVFVTAPADSWHLEAIRDLTRRLLRADASGLRASIVRKKPAESTTAAPKPGPATGGHTSTLQQMRDAIEPQDPPSSAASASTPGESRSRTSIDSRAEENRADPVEWGPGLRIKTAAFTAISYDDEVWLFGANADVFFGAREKPGLVGSLHAHSAIGGRVSPLLDLAASGGVGLSMENLDAYATARLGLDWIASDESSLEVPLSPYAGPQAGFLFASNRRRSFGLGINAAYLFRLDGRRTVLLEPSLMLGKFLIGGSGRLYDDGHQAAGLKVGVAF